MIVMASYIKGLAKIGKYSLVMGTASGVGFATYVGGKSNLFFHKVQSNVTNAFESTKQHAFDFKESLGDQFQNMAVSIQDDNQDDFTNLLSDALQSWKNGVVITLSKEQDLQDDADELQVSPANITMASQPHDQFNPFIKKLLHIQSILDKLKEAGVGADIQLPSIVVIGSQSSGKSSVLESIIGHEFLPKGNNLVTRRPLELTLINHADVYAVFDDMRDLGQMTDFKNVARTLLTLNNAISIDEIANAKPIKLTIYSPFVPDLRLIDLPGYIRVASADQPPSLQQGIESLCAKYVKAPNIILAISAADVDLANSDALRVAKSVDPTGSRTLGILTKLDKIEPQSAANLLANKQYPLKLGYIGVICPPGNPIQQSVFPNLQVGFPTLRTKLVDILTDAMKAYSESNLTKVLDVLDVEKYGFNVNYHDSKVSPNGYIDQLHDTVKQHIRQTVRTYTEHHVLEDIQRLLHLQLINILETTYLVDNDIGNITTSDYWVNQLMHATALLTKSGIGRLATHEVHGHLKDNLGLHHINAFEHHVELKMAVDGCIEDVIKERLLRTVDNIEHILKPWKTEHIGSNVEDIWESSRGNAIEMLKQEMGHSWEQYNAIQGSFGRWTFPSLIKELKTTGHLNMEEEDVKLVQQALYHESRAELLKLRIQHLQKDCKGPTQMLYNNQEQQGWGSWLVGSKREQTQVINSSLMIDESLNPIMRTKKESVICPEAFLFALSSQMAVIAAKYIWLDLVLETYTRLPLELEDRVFSKYRAISRELISENPKVKNQIEAQDRIDLLEKAANELRKVTRDRDK